LRLVTAPHVSGAADLRRLAPDLGDTCSGYLGSYRAELSEAVRRGESGVTVARRQTRIMDGLLGALFCAADAAARDAGMHPRGRLALVAVGGYGRGLVGLGSDVDVLFLCDDPEEPYVRALAEGLLYPLWDLGVDIGHVVRGVDETLTLAQQDIRTATTLIDLRPLAGDRALPEELRRGGRKRIFEPRIEGFLDALEQDTAARHRRFGRSLYLLEPEVKLGRGGLRDLDVARWAARARWDATGPEDYLERGVLLAREVEEVEAARELLWRVRNLLHASAGRRNDRLTFPDQEEIAAALGFVDGVTLGVEHFMQAYYRHARVVAHTVERILERARPRLRRSPASKRSLGDHTLLFDGMMTLERSADLDPRPELALRLYTRSAEFGVPVYPYARDVVARRLAEPAFRESLRDSPEAQALFLELLVHGGAVSQRPRSAFAEAHEVGLLAAMLPEFEPLVGRVQYDAYHVYTTDVHAVFSVDRLRELRSGAALPDLGLAARAMAEAPRLAPLFLAVLLHDVGKSRGVKGHAEHGAGIAQKVARRLGLSAVDALHVAWLVREHGSLFHWAVRRDTHDPDTIRDLVAAVGDPDRLRDLYLLTIAVMGTINPTAMTSWKARALEDLYLSINAAFEQQAASAGGVVRVDGVARAAAIREEVLVGFVGDAGQDQLEAFLDDMPDRYVLANPVDEIRTHARAARDRAGEGEEVHLLPGSGADLWQVLVLADDRPGLLSDVSAVLAARRLSVVSAQIYTRPSGERQEAVDLFLVRPEGGGSTPPNPRTLARIQQDLAQMARGALDAAELLARRSTSPSWSRRPGPRVETDVTVDNTASSRFTVIDVIAADRPALLHHIAEVLRLEGVSIALAKVNTEGTRAVDVFYVVDEHGQKLRDAPRLSRLQRAIEERVFQPERPSRPPELS